MTTTDKKAPVCVTLLLRVSSTGDWGEAKYARADMDLDQVEYIRTRLEDFKKIEETHTDLHEVTFWGASVDFVEDVNGDVLEGKELGGERIVREELEHSGFAILPTSTLPDSSLRFVATDCDRIVLGDEGFYWRAIEKHTDIQLTTRLVTYDDLALIRTLLQKEGEQDHGS